MTAFCKTDIPSVAEFIEDVLAKSGAPDRYDLTLMVKTPRGRFPLRVSGVRELNRETEVEFEALHGSPLVEVSCAECGRVVEDPMCHNCCESLYMS